MYLTVIRPDLAYSVNNSSQFLYSLRDAHLHAAHCVPKYVKGTIGQGIFYTFSSELKLGLFSDSDWAASDTHRSISGFYVLIDSSLISWNSKKQHTVSKLSAESEYRSMALVTCEMVWLIYLLKYLQVFVQVSVLLFCENQAALHIASNPIFHKRTKHIESDCHVVRERIQAGLLKVLHVLLTNPLFSVRFHELLVKMSI